MDFDMANIISDIPPFTKSYVITSLATSLLCNKQYISPLRLYFSFSKILQGQIWRLITPFFFYGDHLDTNLFFHLFFFFRYSSALEEEFTGRSADFVVMLIFGWSSLLIGCNFLNLQLFSSAFTFMLAYIWCRRNHSVQLTFLGLFTFTASYLPFILILFTFSTGGDVRVDLMAGLIGHVYYFLTDCFPHMTEGRRELLKAPEILRFLMGEENFTD